MATLLELRALIDDEVLRNKVAAAACVKASSILTTGTPTATQVAYARSVIADPYAAGSMILRHVVGANSGSTSSQISGASDVTIQNAVNAAMDVLKG